MSDLPLTPPQPPEPPQPGDAPGRDPVQRSIVIFAASALVVLVIVLIAVLATRGDDEGVPTVRIVSLEATDRLAQVVFVAEDDSGRALDVTVDWGDRSPLDQQRGSGELRAQHQYGDDVDSATVVIEVTDRDGRSTRTARTIGLVPPTTSAALITTTSTPAAATTSSSTSTTTSSTSTTVAPTTTSTTSTTTTSTTTTSTTSTTTTSSTTTTLPPDAIERVFELSFDDADSEEFTEGTTSEAMVVSDDSIELVARTDGDVDDALAAVVARWTIPYSEFDQIGEAPTVSVFIDAITDLTMETGASRGRAALFTFDITAVSGDDEIGSGSATERSIENDDEFDDVVDDTVRFANRLDADSTDAIVIELTVECTAFGGTTTVQDDEESRCAADFRARELRVRITRN